MKIKIADGYCKWESDFMNKYLACICKRYGREMLTAIYEVETYSEYYLADELEKLTGIRVDGYTNYVDWCRL